MDFQFPESAEVLRAEVHEFLREHWPPEKHARRANSETLPYEEEVEIRHKLAERGWLVPSWPVEYGGSGKSFWETIVLCEELQYGGVHTGSTAVRIVGPTLMLVGSDEQKSRFLPMIANGDIDFALGYTEPEAGSDLASLKTRAVRDGDHYVINGNKIFTSLAHRAEYCWIATRTDQDAPKHRGITVFIVDMKTPGISIKPLPTMGGGRTNATYWEDVHVPVENRIGEENRGWYYMTSALDLERLAYYTPGGVQAIADDLFRYLRDRAPAWVQKDPYNREATARLRLKSLVARLLYRRAAWMVSEGIIPNYEASISKMFSTELHQEIARVGTKLFGPFGQLEPKDDAAFMDGRMEQTDRMAVMQSFGGGSSELMKNIIATRGMGLPR